MKMASVHTSNRDIHRETETSLHDALCLLAEKWLNSLNYKVLLNHKFKAYAESGELPDAIGWRHGVSILIEVKTSRTDFLADTFGGDS